MESGIAPPLHHPVPALILAMLGSLRIRSRSLDREFCFLTEEGSQVGVSARGQLPLFQQPAEVCMLCFLVAGYRDPGCSFRVGDSELWHFPCPSVSTLLSTSSHPGILGSP